MMQQEFLSLLSDIAILFPVFVFVFTFRGFFKSLVAKLMGDDTPQREGSLTLNPTAHVDIFGLVITMAIILLLGVLFGGTYPRRFLLLLIIVLGVRWTIPIIIDSRNFKYHRLGGVLTSLSGSLGNFLLAIAVLICYKFLPLYKFPMHVQKTVLEFVLTFVDVATWFGVVDLIPLPPFDGGRALYYVLPQSQQYIVEWIEEYALYVFLVLVFMPGVSDLFFMGLHIAKEVMRNFLVGLVF